MVNLKESSRTHNAISNSVVGILSTLVTVILNFAVRYAVIQYLGSEINGLHNLFQSISTFLMLLEAGFSTAMVIFLYKPIQEGNHEEIRAIMHFYAQIYTIIALVFFFCCLLIDIFFLPFLVESTIPIRKVRTYFSIFMFITPLSYLTYSKISILFAEQKNRVFALVSMISQLIFRSLQIISVILTREYYIFLILMIIELVFRNLVCSRYVLREYPFLRDIKSAELSKDYKKEIYNKVRPLFVNNLASSLQSSSQGILIGLLMGNISVVGYFGNYQLISSAIKQLFSQFGASVTSGFGNLAVSHSDDEILLAYKKVSFILNWIAIFFCSIFFSCVQSFIQLFFGLQYVLPTMSLLLIIIELYTSLLCVPVVSVQNALGLHKLDQYAMIIQAISSSALGYVLGSRFGMVGILSGLLIPQICISLIYKGIVVNNYSYGMRALSFIKFISKEFFKGIFVICLIYFICSYINTDLMLLNMIIQAFVAIVIFMFLFLIISRNNPMLTYCFSLLKSLFGDS